MKISGKYILNILKTKENDFGNLKYNVGDVAGVTYESLKKAFRDQPLIFHFEKGKLIIKGNIDKTNELIGKLGLSVNSWSLKTHQELIDEGLSNAVLRLFYEAFRRKLSSIGFFEPPRYRRKDIKSAFPSSEKIDGRVMFHLLDGRINGVAIEGFKYGLEIDDDGGAILSIDPKILTLINYDERYYRGKTVFPFCQDRFCEYISDCEANSIGVGFLYGNTAEAESICKKSSENLVKIEDIKGNFIAVPKNMLYYEAFSRVMRRFGLSGEIKNIAVKRPVDRKKYLDFFINILREGDPDIIVNYPDGDKITFGDLEIMEVGP
jgi:hypothetical protein